VDLSQLRNLVQTAESQLDEHLFVVVHTFKRDGQNTAVCITDRLRKKCRKGKVWKSKCFLTALKNARYGFDEDLARSRGGRDGIFLLDRDYQPRNTMQKKLFDQYIDKSDSGIDDIVVQLDTTVDSLKPVRLVSHHMRLLGILHQENDSDWLILVDYDDTKG